MRSFVCAVMLATAVAGGCNKGEDTGADDDGTPAVEEFVAQDGSSSSVLAGPTAVEYAVMLALIIVVCITAAVNIPAIQDAIDEDAVPSGAAPPDGACYEYVPDDDPLSLTVDLDGCTEKDASGTVTVRKVVAGPVVVSFGSDFQLKGYGVVGSVAFDRAVVERIWAVFDSDADGNAGTPIEVTNLETQQVSEVSLDTRAKIDLNQSMVLDWGTGEVTREGRTDSIYLGGTPDDDLSSDTPPEDVLTWTLPLQDCYCPDDGVAASTIAFVISEVAVDLDDYEARPDDDDEYAALTVDVPDIEVEGVVIVDVTGCGQYTTDFQGDVEATTSMTADDLQTAKDEACGPGGELEDNPSSCDALQTAIDLLPDDWTSDVTLDDEDLDAAASEYVAAEFDQGVCSND